MIERTFPAVFDEHVLEVQRYIYRHGVDSFIFENPAWLTLVRNLEDGSTEIKYYSTAMDLHWSIRRESLCNITGMFKKMFPKNQFAVTVSQHQDNELFPHLVELGLVIDYYMSGWVVTPEAFKEAEVPTNVPDDYRAVPVTDAETRDQFLWVLSKAYTASYGLSPDYTAGLFPTLESLHSEQAQGYVGLLGRTPVRTECLYLIDGNASICHGACIPEHRGKHLGDPLIYLAIGDAFASRAQNVFSQTMPQAANIPPRFGAVEMLRYFTWKKA